MKLKYMSQIQTKEKLNPYEGREGLVYVRVSSKNRKQRGQVCKVKKAVVLVTSKLLKCLFVKHFQIVILVVVIL